jgi:hypothetical protein
MSRLRRPSIILPAVVGAAFLTSACMAPELAIGSYAADGGLLASSNKTASDHLFSMASKKDCALWRSLRGQAICKPREGDADPYAVNYSDPQRMVSEDGIRYSPPLRAAPDAPATSWDAAAYTAAPALTPPAPAATTPVVADSAPVAAPSAASAARSVPPAPTVPKKAKVWSVRKPSRGPAGPGS